MKKNSDEDHADGETVISSINAPSIGSLNDSSREVRITVRKNRIEASRAAKIKPTEEDGK